MPARLLVRAVDGPIGKRDKGDVISVKEGSHVWGAKEGLPTFIQVDISDATPEQVRQYNGGWPLEFRFSIVNQNASGWRLLVEVDPAWVSATGVARDQMKTEMQDWVTEPYEERGAGGTVVDFTTSSMTADVPKTGLGSTEDAAKLAELKSRFTDKFWRLFRNSRFYFDGVDVDTVVGLGGQVTRTKAQVLLVLRDRLAE